MACVSPAPRCRRRATRSRTSSPAIRCRTSGSTSRATPRRASDSRDAGWHVARCPSCSFPTARRWCSRRRASSPRSSGCRRGPTARPRSIELHRCRRRPGRPGGRGLRRVGRPAHGAGRAPRAGRPGGHAARRSRTTSGFPTASAARIWRGARRCRPAASEPRSCRRRTSSRSAGTIRTASPCCRTAPRSRPTRVLIASGMEVRRARRPGVDRAARRRRLLRRRAQRSRAVSRQAHRGHRRRELGGPGRDVLLTLRAAGHDPGARLGRSRRRMSQYLIDRIHDTANVEVVPTRVVAAVHGDGRLEAHRDDATSTNGDRRASWRRDAMFIFIGSAPRTDAVAGLVERDPQGFILTGRDLLVDGQMAEAVDGRSRSVPVRDERSRRVRGRRRAPRIGQARRGGRRRGIGDGQHGSRISGDGLANPSVSRGGR